MDEFDRITVSPKYCSGQPSIRDTRITLSVILRILANGSLENDVLTAYPELEPEDIHQALKYAAWIVSDQIPAL